MGKNKKQQLNRNLAVKHTIIRLRQGIRIIFGDIKKMIPFIFFVLILLIIWMYRAQIFDSDSIGVFSKIYCGLFTIIYPLCSFSIVVIFVVIAGTPNGSDSIENNLSRIGFFNKAGEVPFLATKFTDKNNSSVTIFEFETYGISLKEWEDYRTKIESALNIHIAKICKGQDNRHILLYTVQGTTMLPNKLFWDGDMLRKKSFELVIGQSYIGDDIINLSQIPHILIGGSTGSGKSVLLKHLLIQSIQKDAKVIIADFKGGVDFPTLWRNNCEIITYEDTLIERLEKIVYELNGRKDIFRIAECANIDDYNNKHDNYFKHIIFACDEVAELLDKSGLEKAQKEKVSKIEGYLSTIARQGRAFGIHLVLATQRPDASILTGQIKNNIDCRICGRADNVLSMIILDSTSASEIIPKDAQGRFIHDGILIQGYLFDEEKELV